ncbi:very-long-chain enoyl-CoA reductase-like isoform X3 [Lepisosteus oculatus]|uniref:very-long-chain enoyl-CoA reductase-like isoform X3 n=1 Tax=Lepisosteus oculatus TaxID=7918 RepID=UPI003711BEE8
MAPAQSVELRDLFTLAHFIKKTCAEGMSELGEPAKIKNYVFFEVEILDAKTKEQLCFLDKVEPNATMGEIKCLFHKCYPQWYPSRQALKLDPKGKALKDDEILQNLPVGTTATIYFKDLGPQLGWTMVFLAEYAGPLFIYLLFYFRLPYIYHHKYAFTSSPYPVVTLACVCHSFHYLKRLIETIFVHRFSHGTMPLRSIMRFCEAGNFSIHVALNNLRFGGPKSQKVPYPTKNPFTWLFFFVSCPNYTYEVGAWLGFTIMTQCIPVALFTLVGFIQMTIWAKGKHETYTREFKDYPELRMPIIPFLL